MLDEGDGRAPEARQNFGSIVLLMRPRAGLGGVGFWGGPLGSLIYLDIGRILNGTPGVEAVLFTGSMSYSDHCLSSKDSGLSVRVFQSIP